MNAPERLPIDRIVDRTGTASSGRGPLTVEMACDPYGVTLPLVHAAWAWAGRPAELAATAARHWGEGLTLMHHAVRRAWGLPSADPEAPARDDDRFRDPVWTTHPMWDLVKESYLLMTRQVGEMLAATPGLTELERKRAQFWWRRATDAAAPTNSLWTNPVAVQKAWRTQGLSLAKGVANFWDDVAAGEIRMTPLDAFKVGHDLATTPGVVVMRNRLLEVIHYRPTQPKVHATPVVLITPWINKYYVLDLNPKRSMVRYLLDQGIDVYITSWCNPGAEAKDVTFDAYLTEGIGAIIDTACRVSGSQKVHAVGYCIGGIALCLWMAWAKRAYADPAAIPVADWTVFATLVDFRSPGEIEVFLDRGAVAAIERTMQEKGYLDGQSMSGAFRLLRARTLIWNYVVNGWLYGEAPPPMDVLFWNEDSTRMGAAEHAWYLRELYLENRMIQPDALTLAGQPIDLRRIDQPLYAVACEDDHIAPWKETFRINDHVAGSRRYVLSSSGHILGIVNPVVDPPKRSFRAADVAPGETAEAWRARNAVQPGSWWVDWMSWLKPRLGDLREPPPVSTPEFPALCLAPGTYVHMR